MDTKICVACGIEKGFDQFYSAPRNKFGLSTKCKQCSKIYADKYKESIKARAAKARSLFSEDDTYICNTCGIKKSVFDFTVSENALRGHSAKCKVCNNIRSKENILKVVVEYDPNAEYKCCVCGIVKKSTEYHRSPRSKTGVASRCKSCVKEYQKVWLEENRDEIYARKRKYVKDNKLKVIEWRKRHYKNNKESISAKSRQYYHNNIVSATRSRAIYASKNRSKLNAVKARYKAAKKTQSVIYANQDAIDRKYRVAQILTSITGVEYHCDHVIPLQGEFVSGLHHEDNIMVIKASENLSKSNKFTPKFIKINCSFIHYNRTEEIYQLP